MREFKIFDFRFMQFVVRIVISAAVFWISGSILIYVWTNTIDLRALLKTPFKYFTAKVDDVKSQIPVVDKNAIYQDGVKVADVVGKVTVDQKITTFQYWVNVDNENLDVSRILDFAGKKYKFISMRLAFDEANIEYGVFHKVKVDVQCEQLTN